MYSGSSRLKHHCQLTITSQLLQLGYPLGSTFVCWLLTLLKSDKFVVYYSSLLTVTQHRLIKEELSCPQLLPCLSIGQLSTWAQSALCLPVPVLFAAWTRNVFRKQSFFGKVGRMFLALTTF